MALRTWAWVGSAMMLTASCGARAPDVTEPPGVSGNTAALGLGPVSAARRVQASRVRGSQLPKAPTTVAAEIVAVPVVLFHSICEQACLASDLYGVTRVELGRMMTMLGQAGYETVSIADYARAMRGDAVTLPPKPILITFDDGRLDSYLGADEILRISHARATMYVITALAESSAPRAMSWADVRAAHDSGRWDIQLHADAGHVRIPIDAKGTELPFYANRRWDGGVLEPFGAWRTRVEGDLRHGDELLRSHVPGYQPWSFAVPFGDYGQKAGHNDAAIQGALRRLLDVTFPVWFTQPSESPPFSRPAQSHEQPRFTIHRETTAEKLRAWLDNTGG